MCVTFERHAKVDPQSTRDLHNTQEFRLMVNIKNRTCMLGRPIEKLYADVASQQTGNDCHKR